MYRSDSEYELWVDYYDVVHTGVPGEAEFYVGQAVRMNGDTLELGCGTGRLCIPMAMSGVNVVGMDNSKGMLRRCREKKRAIGKTSGRLKVVEGDMRDFELGRTFDLIVMAYRTFMHLLTSEDQRRCLDCVFRHLSPGGTFIVSLWAARPSHLMGLLSFAPRLQVFAGRYAPPDGEGCLTHYVSTWCDESSQLIEEEHLIHEVNPTGDVVHTSSMPMRRRWTTPKEMDEMLKGHGFHIEALFGDFDCNVFTEESTEMIWVARK